MSRDDTQSQNKCRWKINGKQLANKIGHYSCTIHDWVKKFVEKYKCPKMHRKQHTSVLVQSTIWKSVWQLYAMHLFLASHKDCNKKGFPTKNTCPKWLGKRPHCHLLTALNVFVHCVWWAGTYAHGGCVRMGRHMFPSKVSLHMANLEPI